MSDLLTAIFALIAFAFLMGLGILALAMTPLVLDAIINIQDAVRNAKKNQGCG